MAFPSNYHAESLSELLREALSAAGDDLLVVDPDAETVAELVAVATAHDGDRPTVRVVTGERTLKEAVDDFHVASHAADLTAEGTLALRTDAGEGANTLLVSHGAVVALVSVGDGVVGLAGDDEAFVDEAFVECRDRWNAADEFEFRTPPLSRVRETLATEIGEAVRDDFDAALAAQRTAQGDGGRLDEVALSLLVAARNEVLLYDISKWGEDVGIASKATFSRTKTQLEDVGLIDTEKVPIDVGRPRLRLKLADDLREASAAELVDAARSRLA